MDWSIVCGHCKKPLILLAICPQVEFVLLASAAPYNYYIYSAAEAAERFRSPRFGGLS